MPITNGAYVNPGWVNDTAPYINQTEMNAISNTLAQVPIKNGGTGATTASDALTNLGAEPKANVTSKGSSTTPVYFNSSGVAIAIRGPIPVSLGGTGGSSALTAKSALRAVGYASTYDEAVIGSATQPVYITYNADNDGHFAVPCSYSLNKTVPSDAVFTDTTALSSMTGTLSIAHGGTGATTVPAARNALGLGNTSGALPVANGGTGVTSLSALASAMKAVTQTTTGGTVGSSTTPVYINNGVVTACGSSLKTYTATSPISISGTTISHANSGVTAASKGDTSNQTPAFGDTFKVPSGTVNATGHLTAFADHTVTIPSTTATSSRNGLMTSSQAARLSAIGTRYTNSNNGATIAAGATISTTNVTLGVGNWIILASGNITGNNDIIVEIYNYTDSVSAITIPATSIHATTTRGQAVLITHNDAATNYRARLTNSGNTSTTGNIYISALQLDND